MSSEIVLDIETQNAFEQGDRDPRKLRVSLVGVYFYEHDSFEVFFEQDLPKLWQRMEHADRIIGYNLLHFDYPVLNNYYPGDLAQLPTLDLLVEVENKLGFRLKLDDLARATLNTAKSGHGLEAIEFWRTGNIEALKRYCLDDVRITRDLYEYGKRTSKLCYHDRSKGLSEIGVHFSHVALERKALNLSLPI